MKKNFISITCSLITLLLVVLTLPQPAEAASQVSQLSDSYVASEYTEYLEDGSYFHVTISEEETSFLSRSVQTKSGSRKTTYYNANGTALWDFTVYGTFQYTPGSSAACTSSSYSFNIYDNSWENSYASASKSGNQAIGDATFNEKVFLITTNIRDVHLVLTCSAYGTLS